jgi:hypothetical protein
VNGGQRPSHQPVAAEQYRTILTGTGMDQAGILTALEENMAGTGAIRSAVVAEHLVAGLIYAAHSRQAWVGRLGTGLSTCEAFTPPTNRTGSAGVQGNSACIHVVEPAAVAATRIGTMPTRIAEVSQLSTSLPCRGDLSSPQAKGHAHSDPCGGGARLRLAHRDQAVRPW